MTKRILTRVLVICLVVTGSVYLIASRGLHQGLDLKGGVQVGVRVLTDDAIKGDDKDLPAARQRELRENATVQTMRVLQNRLNSTGVGEISIQRTGSTTDYALQIQVPGAEDPKRVKQLIQATALLEIKLVERGPFETEQAAIASYSGGLPQSVQILSQRNDTRPAVYYVLRVDAAVSGGDLKSVMLSRDRLMRPAVGFALTANGTTRFASVTEQNVGRFLAIVLDGTIQSVAQITRKISGDGIIEGGSKGFALEEAKDLVLILRSGALPARTEYTSELVVGPSLGRDSIRKGMMASIVAVGSVTSFMVAYYRMAGVNAAIAMLVNLLFLLGMMAGLDAILTLPGIAGIVLTIGVGIDSNVLIFERIREELASGKRAYAAVTVGFQRVFRTLIDTHLAAMISAVILGMLGTGAVRGFAVTLGMGLLSNLFTSVFVSRTLFELLLRKTEAKLSI